MKKEKLTACPYCLTPLKGNEGKCPDCSGDLNRYRRGVHSDIADTHDYNYSTRDSEPQSPLHRPDLRTSKPQSTPDGTNPNKKKNSRTVLVFSILVVMAINILPQLDNIDYLLWDIETAFYNLQYNVENVVHDIFGSPPPLPEIYAEQNILTSPTDAVALEEFYKTVEATTVSKPDWFGGDGVYTLGYIDDAQEYSAAISQDEQSLVMLHGDGFAVYGPTPPAQEDIYFHSASNESFSYMLYPEPEVRIDISGYYSQFLQGNNVFEGMISDEEYGLNYRVYIDKFIYDNGVTAYGYLVGYDSYTQYELMTWLEDNNGDMHTAMFTIIADDYTTEEGAGFVSDLEAARHFAREYIYITDAEGLQLN